MARPQPIDAALALLASRLAPSRPESGKGQLWVAGEQGVLAGAPAGLQALSNRVDVALALRAQGLECALTDFDFGPWPAASLARVYYRVSKEKALVHHVINQALARLAPGGELLLAGERQDGLKTYLDKAATLAGGERQLEKGPGGALLGTVRRGPGPLGEPLPDQDYARLREVVITPQLTVWSKPGIFGWQKCDAGSALLIDSLDALALRQPPASLLDLGCGYGYLSLMAARRWSGVRITATDNNLAAVAACTRNFEAPLFQAPLDGHAIRGEVIAADCADGIDARFDLVLCNPPFHQGFDMQARLGQRFVQAALRRLAPGGQALFVVNQFLPLERLVAEQGAHARELARTRSFKVLALTP